MASPRCRCSAARSSPSTCRWIPHALAARQIGINEVETALKNWNVNVPTGTIVGPHKAFTLQATGQLMNADQYKPMVVAFSNGAPVRLGSSATIIDGVEDPRTGAWLYDADRQPARDHARHPATARHEHHRRGRRGQGASAAVPDGAARERPHGRALRPVGHHPRVLPRRPVHDGADAGLVIFVIFVFLRNMWATVIPSLALPFSIIGTFAVMYLLSYSLDNLSMMALILSVGFVVDDAIVMLENIYRHVE